MRISLASKSGTNFVNNIAFQGAFYIVDSQ
ncbi:hypothetical protein SAMN05444161_4818 [Rhizobiales bacterium GAS191]|nr:hypothetical protein SAMN05444161_4818 [Rhizobiales bacterium GAS191]